MINELSRPISTTRRLILAGAVAVATIVAIGLALQARLQSPELFDLPLDEIAEFALNPYFSGYVFQGVIVPAVLIYLLSTTKLFRRAVSGQTTAHDSLKLFGALAVIQLLVLVYDLGRTFVQGEPGPVILGLLVVVTGGLLGGWRMGLGLGLITFLFRGTQELALMLSFGLGQELASIYRFDGLWALLSWPEWWGLLRGPFLYNLWVSSAVWAGIVAGLVAELLGPWQFSPLAAAGLGAGIDLGAGLLMAMSGQPPGIMFLIPSILISAAAMAAVALMVRNVQADAARRQAEAAELALTRAELRALRAQINPHFLFNSLNTIRYFVRTDPAAARRLLLDLSEVFQRALRSGEFVSLQDELSYVRAYLALEQARLDERLRVEWNLPQEGTEEAQRLREQQVPTLILQPIVENAVLHGAAKKTGGGRVRVWAGLRNGDLLLEVADNGPGIEPARLAQILDPETELDGSIGLRNVDRRLRALYGGDYGLAIRSEAGQGTRVLIRIPIEE